MARIPVAVHYGNLIPQKSEWPWRTSVCKRDLPVKSPWASPRAPGESCRSRNPGRTRRTSDQTAPGSRSRECLQDFSQISTVLSLKLDLEADR